MRQFTSAHLRELLENAASPCISLYQPTHRHRPDNQQDPIRFRNMLKEMESALLRTCRPAEVRDLTERFRKLADDRWFWDHRTEGLAILASPSGFDVFDLQRPVRELLTVSDSFHIKPLLRIVQSADRYQILCLNRQEASLFEGNRDAMDQVDMVNVPATITEALGEELTEPHQTVASYGSGAGKGGKEMRHGHGGRKDELDIDMERFFRAIDRAILENHSRPSGLPLMLAALPEYHTHFRNVSHNPQLLEKGLEINPGVLTVEEMREQAWRVMEPYYLRRLAGLIARFEAARARELGSDDLDRAARAAVAGRVETLLLEADRVIPGRIDEAEGRILPGPEADPGVNDTLDDLAEAVLRRKGEVIIVPAERMPSATGLAAIFRF
jgi:hypothetical protein